MRRTLITAALALMVLFCAGRAAMAQDLSMLPPDLADIVEELIATRFPPELHGITFDPETPVADEPTNVEVEIYNNADLTDDETFEVYLLFSPEFGVWDYIELDTDDDEVWYGELPGFESGAEVIYAVHAIDSSGNVYTDVPCFSIAEEDIYTKDYIMDDCINSTEDPAACSEDAILPRGCMMRMSIDEDGDDDDDTPPTFDLLDQRIGYDGEFIYLDQVYEDKVTEGTMNPVDLHLYASLSGNWDVAGDTTALDDLLTAGGLMAHAPLAEMAGGMILPCLWGYSSGGEFAQDEEVIECNDSKNHLIFQLDMAALGDSDTNRFVFLTANGAITNFPDPIEGKPYDWSHWTLVHFTEDNYLVVE